MPRAVSLISTPSFPSLPLLWLLFLSPVLLCTALPPLSLPPSAPLSLRKGRWVAHVPSARTWQGEAPTSETSSTILPKASPWALDTDFSNMSGCNTEISLEIAGCSTISLQLCPPGLQINTRLPHSSRKKETFNRISRTRSWCSSSEIRSQALGKAWMFGKSPQWTEDRRYFLFRYELR